MTIDPIKIETANLFDRYGLKKFTDLIMPKKEFKTKKVVSNGDTLLAFSLIGISVAMRPLYTMGDDLDALCGNVEEKDKGKKFCSPFFNDLTSASFNDDLLCRDLTNISDNIGPTEFYFLFINHIRSELKKRGELSNTLISNREFALELLNSLKDNKSPKFSVSDRLGNATDPSYYHSFERALKYGLENFKEFLIFSPSLYAALDLRDFGSSWLARVPDDARDAMAAKISNFTLVSQRQYPEVKFADITGPIDWQRFIIVKDGSFSSKIDEKKVKSFASKEFKKLARTAFSNKEEAVNARDKFLSDHPLFNIEGCQIVPKSKRTLKESSLRGRPRGGAEMNRSYHVKGFLSPKDGAFEKQSLICLATNDFDSSAEEIVSLYFNRARADEYRPRFLPFSHGKSGKISFFAKNANRSEGAKAVSSLIFFLHSLMEFQAAKDLNDPSEIKS